MVFPSVPVFRDPPNLNQQQQAQQTQYHPGSSRAASEIEVPQILPPGLAAPDSDGPVSTSVSRPASTAERARLAKIPQPAPARKCPRCDSTNTKFCYYNNYSLSQPRYFCKTCRRYWTHGGALRNVPVGGGCRRNKRSKSGSSSKSSGASSSRQAGAPTTSSAATPAAAGAMASSSMPLQSQMPFLASLRALPDYVTPNLGGSFGGFQPFDAGGLENLRIHQPMQQLPFLGALETHPALAPAPVTGLYSLVGEGGSMGGGSLMGQVPTTTSHTGIVTQLASVKMDERNAQVLKFPGQYMGTHRNIDSFWNSAGSSSGGNSGGGGTTGGGWAKDLSSFSSSATGDRY